MARLARHPSPAAPRDSHQQHLSTQPLALPADHPHAYQQNLQMSRPKASARSSTRKPLEIYDEEQKRPGLHKKTKSSVSLKSLLTGEKEKVKTSRDPSSDMNGKRKPKKTKSSTSLSAIFSRPLSSKGPKEAQPDHNKENQTPPSAAETAPAPIWAQFATQVPNQTPIGTKVPLNDSYHIADEISKYTPDNYSPSKQRNFHDYSRPTLVQGGELRPRPKSDVLPSNPSKNAFIGTLSRLRKGSDELSREQNPSNKPVTRSSSRRSSLEKALSLVQRPSQDNDKNRHGVIRSQLSGSKQSSRVMAAVAALQGKSREPEQTCDDQKRKPGPELNQKAIDDALEELLETRNIPSGVRERMRACDVQVKASFVRSESTTFAPPAADKPRSDSTEMAFHKLTANSASTEDAARRGRPETNSAIQTQNEPRKSRSRSRTFTFSKNGSPSKKQRADRPRGHSRTKSAESTFLSRPLSSSLTTLNKTQSLSTPQDFIGYLSKEQEPRFVEVGKIHKLRQVLRNETVVWVDEFIAERGMEETLNLLYRTVEMEWREEHEDSLLHETLLCLKALFTTATALRRLEEVQKKLFPTLLHMIFDEERKGPSEFSTRNVIVALLLTYLTSSPASTLPDRARTLLSYLRDPSKPEEKQPPNFIATIYQPRPYRIWNNEMLSVTKEVFWIFMHHYNIMSSPSKIEDTGRSYVATHFPKERPPVAAAPYIGGVEWEATTYIATHLDLLNAIVASLPTSSERNSLRRELRDSGFEKCMGGQLRVCTEKFYGHVHAGLITWIGAASEDGWPYEDVRQGPPRDVRKSPRKTASPKKKQNDKPPVLDMPKLDLGVHVGKNHGDAWLS